MTFNQVVDKEYEDRFTRLHAVARRFPFQMSSDRASASRDPGAERAGIPSCTCAPRAPGAAAPQPPILSSSPPGVWEALSMSGWKMKYCLIMCVQARNRLGRINGVAPIQELLGIEPLTTYSLIQQVADLKVKHAALVWIDAHERLRVGLNSRSRPTRLAEVHKGAQVWVWNRPAGQDRHRLQDFGKVHLETHGDDKCLEGPGYVVKAESITSVWVRLKERLRKYAVENIRLVTPDELVGHEHVIAAMQEPEGAAFSGATSSLADFRAKREQVNAIHLPRITRPDVPTVPASSSNKSALPEPSARSFEQRKHWFGEGNPAAWHVQERRVARTAPSALQGPAEEDASESMGLDVLLSRYLAFGKFTKTAHAARSVILTRDESESAVQAVQQVPMRSAASRTAARVWQVLELASEPEIEKPLARVLKKAIEADTEAVEEQGAIPYFELLKSWGGKGEVKYKKGNNTQKFELDESHIKQIDSHLDLKAVECVAAGEFTSKERVLGSRALHVNKLAGIGDWKAFTMWITDGHNDPDKGGFESSSSTTLILCQQTVLFYISMMGGFCSCADDKSVFLHGRDLEQSELLFLWIPGIRTKKALDHFLDRLGPNCRRDILRVRKGAFGLQASPGFAFAVYVDFYTSMIPLTKIDTELDMDAPTYSSEKLELVKVNVPNEGAARQGRYALSFRASQCPQELSVSNGHTLAKANQVTRRTYKGLMWKVKRPLPAERLDELIFLVASDGGSLGGMPREGSKLDASVILAGPEVLEPETDVCVMEDISQRMRRQVRSFMGVEVGAMNMAMEHVDFAKAIFSEIQDPVFDVRSWRRCIARWRQIDAIDAKTAFASLSVDVVPKDRRTAADIIAVKADREDESNTSLRWFPGEQQASADITKWSGYGLMAPLLATGRCCIKEDAAVRVGTQTVARTQERPEGPASSRKERCASDKHECRGIACSPSR